jgi:hypothetical protein
VNPGPGARLVLTILVLLLPACVGGRSRAPSPSSTARSPSPALTVEPIVTVDPGVGRVHSVVTWGHYVGWAAGTDAPPGPGVQPSRVLVHDLDDKTTRVLARTHFPGGTIERIRASKDTVVYVDLAREATAEQPGAPWHLYEVSVSTGRERRLASSATALDEENPPRPSIVWPWVAWLQATDAEGRVAVRSLDLRNGEQRTLVPSSTGVQSSMDDVTASVYYDDDNGTGGRDVFAVPVDGSGPPTRVSASGRAGFPIARNGAVAWQQPPGGDSDSLWHKALPRGPEQQFAATSEGLPAGSNSFPGRGFVVYLGREGLMVGHPSGAVPPVRLDEGGDASIPARWWVEGDRVAWASIRDVGSPEERSTIHLSRVRP